MFNPAFAVRDATPHLPTAVLGPSSLLPTAIATSYFLLARYFLRETTAPPFLDNVDRDTVAFGRLLLQPARFLWRFILVRSLQFSPDTVFARHSQHARVHGCVLGHRFFLKTTIISKKSVAYCNLSLKNMGVYCFLFRCRIFFCMYYLLIEFDP